MSSDHADVAIIDYGAGNLRSVAKAIDVAAPRTIIAEITADPDRVAAADRIILPGVGAFGHCRTSLARCDGMIEALEEAVKRRGIPFLGICVGMQLMVDYGREDGTHRGFGWISGECVAITHKPGLRVPHMGWNTLAIKHDHAVFAAARTSDAHAYFVHSYRLDLDNESDIVLTTDYGSSMIAAIARDNMVGTQFHPEKSQTVGLQILTDFLAWTP